MHHVCRAADADVPEAGQWHAGTAWASNIAVIRGIVLYF
jgi:hypothetical protein